MRKVLGVKTRLNNGLTAAQAEQFQVARTKRWTHATDEARATQGRKMHVGMARRVLLDVWPEGLPEFEARLNALGVFK